MSNLSPEASLREVFYMVIRSVAQEWPCKTRRGNPEKRSMHGLSRRFIASLRCAIPLLAMTFFVENSPRQKKLFFLNLSMMLLWKNT
jgi:hypothetical protein